MEAKSERLQNKYKQQYRDADRKVKRMARENKRKYLNSLASQAEEAANREQGKVYKITRTVCGRYYRTVDTPITDKYQRQKQRQDGQNTSREVLNRPPPTAKGEIQEPEIVLDIDTPPPNEKETVSAIRMVKNGKATGQDNLNTELFKIDPELSAKMH